MNLTVENYYPQKKRWWLRLPEKNGKVHEMPCYQKLEAYLDAYLAAASIADDRRGPLFRAANRKTKTLTNQPLSRVDVWYMIHRRATDYPSNGGRIEIAQRLADHANTQNHRALRPAQWRNQPRRH